MRQLRRPGERLFVDYAGMTVKMLVGAMPSKAQVCVAAMGVSGLIFARATRTRTSMTSATPTFTASSRWAVCRRRSRPIT